MALKQQKFMRCVNCNTPFLYKKPLRTHRRGVNLSCWCRKCKRKRTIARSKAFYKKQGTYKQDAAEHNMVNVSAHTDKERFKAAADYDYRSHPRYITSDYLKQLRVDQDDQCYFCDRKMNTVNRQKDDGLTVERLNDEPHWKDTCVLSCMWCNRRSWREKWSPFPLKLGKILGHKTDGGYLLGQEFGTKWTFIEATRKWIVNGISQYKIPSRMPSRLCVRRQARLLEELRHSPRFA